MKGTWLTAGGYFLCTNNIIKIYIALIGHSPGRHTKPRQFTIFVKVIPCQHLIFSVLMRGVHVYFCKTIKHAHMNWAISSSMWIITQWAEKRISRPSIPVNRSLQYHDKWYSRVTGNICGFDHEEWFRVCDRWWRQTLCKNWLFLFYRPQTGS